MSDNPSSSKIATSIVSDQQQFLHSVQKFAEHLTDILASVKEKRMTKLDALNVMDYSLVQLSCAMDRHYGIHTLCEPMKSFCLDIKRKIAEEV